MIQILDTPAVRAAGVFIALLTLLSLVLALGVVRQRYRTRVLLGSGGDEQLERAIRMHGNFVEYVPFGMALLIVLSILGSGVGTIHALGLSLFVGRISHALGLAGLVPTSAGRGLGMLLTWGNLLCGSVVLLLLALG